MVKASSYEEEVRLFLSSLHGNIALHPGQVPVARAVFSGFNIKADCGRKFGKTTVANYIAARMAASQRDFPLYVIGPWSKQIREIYWQSRDPNRLTKIVHPKFIKRIYQQDMRVVLWNNSFIKFDGSDDPDIHRGITCGHLVMDEQKDFDPEFWPAMEPNLVPMKALFSSFGTPPDTDATASAKQYLDLTERCQTDKSCKYFRLPSHTNPHIDRSILEAIKVRLLNRGEEDVWLREYEGVFVKGGHGSIFPMFNRDVQNVFPHEELFREVQRDSGSLEWHTSADPGTATKFGQLFLAYNRYTATVYVLDELYVGSQAENSVVSMYGKEAQIIDELYPYPDEWLYTYDEAALWFWNERNAMKQNYGWMPSDKGAMKRATGEQKPGISWIKDAMRFGKLKISDRCKNLIYEIESYIKDKDGNIPKRDDHLLDPLRYFFFRIGYSVDIMQRPAVAQTSPALAGRAYTLREPTEDGFDFNMDDSWTF